MSERHTAVPGEPGTATQIPGTPAPSIVWFRDDLRLADHPALHHAITRGAPVVAVFVLDEESPGIRPLGGASLWWLHNSLRSLTASLGDLGVPLVLRRGPAESIITEIAASTRAGAVYWNRRYGQAERDVDTRIKATLPGSDCDAQSFAGSLLFEPWTITTGQGNPYSVFTPFWRACNAAPLPRNPYPAPTAIVPWPGQVATDDLDDWGLEPHSPDWADGLRAAWQPGEAPAHKRLHDFLSDSLGSYAEQRDLPAENVTSRLSPHLRWGEISPYQVWHATREATAGSPGKGPVRFLTELGWREFSYHVLFHAPHLATENWRPGFDAFPWHPLDETALEAWQRGRTGFPLVDAGMRELWRTGTMHNRVRMVTASFLTKNLLIDWREGERWFWDTLVDADPASNPASWQWVAGSGADAAPYFRVFNPQLQFAKFDPNETYVRANIDEWGTDAYPAPIVDLADSRRAALAAYEQVKGAKTPPDSSGTV
ncbi:cryptochrome/photolyase family protein [Cryobacterium psychrophilum]|uniref:Deoxyribodipyrimidine photo-lyase n=1 Tax=Cryobacterium psychrophilum TaxID=41988 RepID=A0A4Y8KPR0_9MICO|nr:deoxyribodipyrimidine photo-lyase [Cryobacterium psychrophilum]TDW30443.1 deoxyribodipyrimidine photo-lyase type I [Cryobacterium psychrophilum]TFD79523.1 deoxyribodipyrimidine photo-lyase [Cryobacterium psychrophilum]